MFLTSEILEEVSIRENRSKAFASRVDSLAGVLRSVMSFDQAQLAGTLHSGICFGPRAPQGSSAAGFANRKVRFSRGRRIVILCVSLAAKHLLQDHPQQHVSGPRIRSEPDDHNRGWA